jgi:hypothetical protein
MEFAVSTVVVNVRVTNIVNTLVIVAQISGMCVQQQQLQLQDHVEEIVVLEAYVTVGVMNCVCYSTIAVMTLSTTVIVQQHKK